MKVLFTLVTLALIAGSTADFMTVFNDCCTEANLSEAQKQEMMDTVKEFKDTSGFSDAQLSAVSCAGSKMKVINGGKVNAMMVTMAASSVFTTAQRGILKKCLLGINEVDGKAAAKKALACCSQAKQS